MSSRQGSLLEKQVESIFSSAGFETETNEYQNGYEVDVYSKLGDLDIVAECKQYENSNLSVRNLIHQWDGKNDSIGADVLVLVIYGQKIKEKEKKLAEEKNIDIWDEQIVKDLLNKNEEELKDFVFESLPIDNDRTLGDSYKTQIRKLVWEAYLSGVEIDEEEVYEKFLMWSKQRIRRELFIQGSTKRERKRHIETFKDVTKRKGKYDNEVPVNSSEKKFEIISLALVENSTPFDEDREERYRSYLESLHEEYNNAKNYYMKPKGRKRKDRLIKSRIEYLENHPGQAKFSDKDDDCDVEVLKPERDTHFELQFEMQSESDLEEIRWILTREGSYDKKEFTDSEGRVERTEHQIIIAYDEVKEVAEAVQRVFDEYYGKDLDEFRMVDLNLSGEIPTHYNIEIFEIIKKFLKPVYIDIRNFLRKII